MPRKDKESDPIPPTPPEPPKSGEPITSGKSFKPNLGKFTELKVNQSHTGVFLGCKYTEIIDSRSKNRDTKSVLVIKLRDKDNPENVLRLACATMLERAWEDVVDEYGNGDHDMAVTRLRGHLMTVNRGEDGRTATTNNPLGSYEIIVWS